MILYLLISVNHDIGFLDNINNIEILVFLSIGVSFFVGVIFKDFLSSITFYLIYLFLVQLW